MTRNIVGLALALAAGGCAPFLTPIPTYWDPVYGDPPGDPWPAATSTVASPPRPAAVAVEAAIDVATPHAVDGPLDVEVAPDTPEECLSIYVISHENRLFAFDPRENAFTLRGELSCPRSGGATPFSMAVSRSGLAHVLYTNGRLYRVEVDDATCSDTPFVPNQQGFRLFGMGYAPDEQGGESLHVAQIGFVQRSRGLARIDTETYELTPIGMFSQNPGFQIELTPNGSGPLYGYFLNERAAGGTLVAIDTRSAAILEATPLPAGSNSSSLAVSAWGGYFFIFTSRRSGSEVSRYDPKTGTTEIVARFADRIVGAGASTCAPPRAAERGKDPRTTLHGAAEAGR